MNLTRTAHILALLILGLGLEVPLEAAQVYYTDLVTYLSTAPVIKRVDADGSGMKTLVTGVSHPRSIALDVLGGKMYWNELGLSVIRRANLDGTGPESVVVTGDSAGGLALDVAAGKLYWTTGNIDRRVRRSNLDGSEPEDLITTGQLHPVAVALDTIHGKLYWTDLEGNLDGTGSIKRSNLNGSNAETLLTGIDEANGLACDAVGGKIYWTELATHKIQRASLDGTGVEDLVTGLNIPTTIGLDLVARKMYWTDDGLAVQVGQINRILKANLDGSNVEVVVSALAVSGVGRPWGIAVDAGPRINLIKAVKPAFSELAVGANYQLQLSSGLNTWTNHGSVFTATNASMIYPQYWDVENWGNLFFRLSTAP